MKNITGKLKFIDKSNICRIISFNTNKKQEFDNIDIESKIIKTTYGFRLKILLQPKSQLLIKNLFLELDYAFNNNDKIFLNGYQTWTESREFNVDERIKGFNKILKPVFEFYKVKNFGDSTIVKYSGKKGVLHGFTYSYIKSNNNLNFFGSLNENTGYTIFKYFTKKNKLNIIKDCKNLIINKTYAAFDIIFNNGKEEEVFGEYFNLLKIPKPRYKSMTGWTSWYNYYINISEKIILDNLKAFKENKIPIDIIQIDDGYQKAVGDWLMIKPSFPNGMKYAADKIKKSGYLAGIWISPFICQKKSDVFKNHQDWLLKDKRGKNIKLGYNKGCWDDHFYILDFYNKNVREYIKKVFDAVINNWGFDMIKIDFLYAVSLYSRMDKTRAQITREALSFLKKNLKDKIILACGVPIGAVFGMTDYCRIGPDTALTWENNLYKKINYRERISTINSILDTIHRRHLNGNVFLNDPDVFILREINNELLENQKYTLFLINQIFGSLLFTSDNINEYSNESLNLYKSQFPVKEKRNIKVENKNLLYKINFEINKYKFIALCNLSNKVEEIKLDTGIYFCNKKRKILKNLDIKLDPYESMCFLKIGNNDFELFGDTIHLFPCSMVKSFTKSKNNIILKFEKNTINKGKLFIKIPNKYKGINVNNKYIKAKKISDFNIVVLEN